MSQKITVQDGDLTFDVTTGNIAANVPLFVQEQAAANTDVAGYGQFWVRNDTPNTLMFTDDTGIDFIIGGASSTLINSTGTPTNNQLAVWTNASTLEGDANLTWDGTNLSATQIGGIIEANFLDKTAAETVIGAWTHSGRLVTDDSTTVRAGFNIPTGIAPTTPVQGDMWVTATDIFARINGVSESLLEGSVPTTITVANEAVDTTSFVSFFTAATGDLGPKTNTNFTFNAANATLSATTFTGALSGNATTATTLATSRTIGMTGDVVWTSAAFNGGSNVTGTSTIQSDSVTMDMIIDIATDTFLGRVTVATGTVEVLTNAQAKTALDLTGTNSGDNPGVTSVTGGTGVASSGGTTPSISLTVDELAEKTGVLIGTDRLVGTTGTTNWAETISGIPLSIFNNDLGLSGTVTSVVAGNGLDFTTITTTGSVILGTPGSSTASSSNAVTATSHTHAIDSTIARIAGPTFTGVPAAPTASVNTNTTQLATTAYVIAQITDDVPSASLTVAGIVELATITETNTGTDATRAVTPDGLDGWTGSAQFTTAGVLTATSYGGIAEANLVDKAAAEILLGTWTLDGTISESGFGTGGKVKDGDDNAQPIGFNVLDYNARTSAYTLALAGNGQRFNRTVTTAFDITCPDLSTLPVGATYVFSNQGASGTFRVKGALGVTVRHFDGGAVQTVVAGNGFTLATGGILTVNKVTDTEYHIWGTGITTT